jgi:predicted dehydrogenase
MKFAIIGAGSIGKRHIGNLLSLGIAPKDIHVFEPREDRRQECASRFGLSQLYARFEDIGAVPVQAALLCSPTSEHISQAAFYASRGSHLLIEKPLAHDLTGAEELRREVAAKGVQVLVAYCIRFSEHARKLKETVAAAPVGRPLYVHGEFSEYLPDWHPWEDYRTFYMARSDQGGGSLLDQSHIMDLAHWCFGPVASVFGFSGRVSDLEVESDDLAEMQVRFASGLVGTIHQDMFGRRHAKHLTVKCTDGDIAWDMYDLSVSVFDVRARKTETFAFGKDHQVMYLNELRHFLDLCAGTADRPLCGLDEGIHGMRIIEAVRRSQASGRLEAVAGA